MNVQPEDLKNKYTCPPSGPKWNTLRPWKPPLYPSPIASTYTCTPPLVQF